ncbi:tripartite tricarboxylate transporter substrate binding protein [Rhodovarius crocodyli]|uniref:Tripartite tricarboxylate transporter substrate binding protein n=1 Tax=Rhodovarius crocodyli TaxID=1979269 RepID=A0A437LX74_9PROT|nr:tripartite tricarboxylate transporter substrate binding protein [Rhodovarius crocodyli]RVT90008.1 tripartite tricarboxylate transporter substrate binding protein [Rhodovarius crocodyli]
MRHCLLGLLFYGVAMASAVAQNASTIVVNFGSGGSADRMARLIAPEMGTVLGTQVVVKNTTGAAGAIGATEVARARADGTTLLLTTTGPMAIQPHFRADLPYRVADFAPVCLLGDAPVMMMAAPVSGIRSVADLLARARRDNGINYGSAGPGSIPHIVMAALAQSSGAQMTHVPFRGSAEAIIALLRDDVSVYADLPGGLRANNLVPVGVMAAARTAEFPETPTLREQGVDMVYSIWAGLYAPAATPPATLARLEAACRSALGAASVIDGFARLATPITFRGQADFAAFQAAELEKFRQVIQSAGLRPGD